MVYNLVVALSHPYIFIYLDSVGWKIQSSGMLKCISWQFSFPWCTIMGLIKHLPSDWVHISYVQPNCDWSPVCTFHMGSHGKYL